MSHPIRSPEPPEDTSVGPITMKESQDESTTCRNSENSAGTVPNGLSGVHSKSLSLVQGLRLCQDAWAPKMPWDRHGAHAALWGRPAGSFLVVQGSSSDERLLCISVGIDDESVKDFPILVAGSALRLTASHLAFPDVFQLLHFYTLSRDVLPVCLLVPSWVYAFNSLSDHFASSLGPKAWLCSSSDPQIINMTPGTPETEMPEMVMCTIQLTAANGALCFINPLYLQEHGDDWLTSSSASPNSPIRLKREKRLSTTRAWEGRGLKQRSTSQASENSGSFDRDRGSFEKSPVSPATPGGVVLRRGSSATKQDPLKRASSDSIHSPLPQSPHRVSWIEDKIWLNAPPPSSLLHLPLELDSLSISSIEEESEPVLSPSPSQQSPRLPLADKVKNRLSAVGQALGGLVSPQRRLSKRVQEMAERKDGAFAEAVRTFIEQTLATGNAPGVKCAEMLQEVRSSLTALRESLFDYPEIQSITDGLGDMPDFELDALLELALHKVALKPVYTHLYVCLKTARRDDDTLQRLETNKSTLENRSLEELEGAAGAGVPDTIMIEKIQQHWTTMHEAYSPSKKVHTLLKVCKNIYHSMNANSKPGVVFGADDFLPCLTWVLLRSNVTTLQIDTDYMMELLDPTQLQGEGGYYLTSLYAALFYISSFRPRLAKRQLSAEAQKSLSQWHRRRTLHCNQSRRSKNRRTIRRHGPAEGGGVSSENDETDSAHLTDDNNHASSNVQETLQSLDEELDVVKEEEEDHLSGQQTEILETLKDTRPKEEDEERAAGVSWKEYNLK